MLRTNSQDYGADETLHTTKPILIYKITRFISKIIIPSMFDPPEIQKSAGCGGKTKHGIHVTHAMAEMRKIKSSANQLVQRAACALPFAVPSKINRNHPINQTSTPSFYLSHSLEGCVP